MCRTSAALCFGITVRVTELCLAGNAFAAVNGSLIGLDLILARKNKGTLETSIDDDKVDVRALPTEVWELIKAALLKVSYADEYRRREVHYHGKSDQASPEAYWRRDKREYDEQPLLYHNLMLDFLIFEERFVYNGGISDIISRSSKVSSCIVALARCAQWDDGPRCASQNVVALLKYFGLCRPTQRLISMVTEDTFCDLEAAWIVAIPLVGDDVRSYPHLRPNIPHVEFASEVYRVSRISPSAFILPEDAYARFSRLLAAFPAITPMTSTSSTIRSPAETIPPRAAGDEASVEFEASAGSEAHEKQLLRAKERAERKKASEPAWMLCGGGSSCDETV